MTQAEGTTGPPCETDKATESHEEQELLKITEKLEAEAGLEDRTATPRLEPCAFNPVRPQ